MFAADKNMKFLEKGTIVGIEMLCIFLSLLLYTWNMQATLMY